MTHPVNMTAKALGGILFLTIAANLAYAEVLGTFDFEGTGTEFMAKNVATGVSFSQLATNNLTEVVVEPQANSLTGMADGNYLSIPGDSGTVGGTGDAISGGLYLSFSLTNNTGGELLLSGLSVTVGGDNIYDYFLARVYTDVQSSDDVIGDTIGVIGANPSGVGTASFAAFTDTVLFSSPEGANIIYPDDFTLADGETINFTLPFVHPSSSGARTGEIDNIRIEAGEPPTPRPNILWIVAEDMSPNLGCYGDTFATSPNIDTLAANSLRYERAWSNAPVCSPARSTLIAGMYGTTTGSTYHRYEGGSDAPSFLEFYPKTLQDLGYYTSNNSKEDYNIGGPLGGKGWNESSGSAHWRNRPNAGIPFMAVFNYMGTHESTLDNYGSTFGHDPDLVPLPPYHPDVPDIRKQWAQHYDKIEDFDTYVQALLDELAADGLADDTIVFVYADHGTCVPGGKRYVGNRGQHVPLIVHFPDNFAHLAPPGYAAGSTSTELVSFVDFAPTLLSLAGEEPRSWHHGRAFAGEYYEAAPDYIYGYSDRTGERTWLTRSVTDGRYVYIRNYRPDQPHGLHNEYAYDETFAGIWQSMFHNGELTPEQAHYWTPQGPEELYDLQTDPYELNNLVHDPASQTKLLELRAAHLDWRETYGDLAFLTEGIMHELKRDSGMSEWDLLQNATHYPKADLHDTVDRASSGDPADVPVLVTRLEHTHPSVRHWALIGLMLHGRDTVRANEAAILSHLSDASVWVRATAAQVLATHGSPANQVTALDYLFAESADSGASLESNSFAEREVLVAMHALDQLPYIPESYEPQLDNLEQTTSWTSAFRDHMHRAFHEQYNNPLLEFRHLHGLNKFGADDLANPSGDGISNILKFAFNLAPNEGDLDLQNRTFLAPGGIAGLPSLTNGGDGTFTYRYLHRIPMPDSTDSSVFPAPHPDYTVQSSNNLIDWPTFTASPTTDPIDANWERVIHTFPSNEASEFLRVEIKP